MMTTKRKQKGHVTPLSTNVYPLVPGLGATLAGHHQVVFYVAWIWGPQRIG